LQLLKDLLVSFFTIVFNAINGVVGNVNYSYGLAIITFTLIIRILLLPLNIKQIKSQSKMQVVQPEVQKIQAKYKNDPQKAQKEIMQLYKEHDANPMSGCLPLLIQMPILFAMYYVYSHLEGIAGVSFLWVSDLSKPDKYYILPILSTATTYLSSILITSKSDNSPQAKQMSTMNTTMALVMGFMSINFQAALVLYWVVNNLIQIGQTLIMKKLGLIGKPITGSDKENTGVQKSSQIAKEVSTDGIKSASNKKKR
jgi:YidC/Oxa1 family membrane protein insertase